MGRANVRLQDCLEHTIDDTNPDELPVHVNEAAVSHGQISWQMGKG